ncbi:thiamine pyrophosphate-dependent enzyme [Desulfobacula sp.]|uniref:thiamine pyrophosphate-dependent enzyme n=1 Tax=Desulfobacula sp. TaxID=2593537 RepID=UPI002638A6C1|nr:thiamine pyrophosphate-dependent enzyme [Desulfobacula sp.]
MKEEFLLGNGAIALGILEAGCQIMTSYPGTPSSEILPEVVRFSKAANLNTSIEWSVNEKVAFDNAFAAAISGKRAACCMKMVGLNVAADSFMSAAYIGNIGGLVIISCDDPGPHSSQTEQDSRLMARLGKVPVLDPGSPEEAREMIKVAFDLSEEFQVPVMVRPAIRVCHARQNITYGALESNLTKADFKREPSRWASTPKFRLIQHKALNEKHERISERFNTLTPFNMHTLEKGTSYPFGVVTGGVPSCVVQDMFEEYDRKDIPVLKLGAPYPFPERLADEFMDACDKVLVIEETDTLIEYMLRDKHKTLGRLTHHVPMEGELVPEKIEGVLNKALSDCGLPPLSDHDCGTEAFTLVGGLDLPIRKPTLCPGCPHRASFYSIRKALPKAIYPSDIGCYTLGSNLGVVDTVLDMGAGITMASGFWNAYIQDDVKKPIVATIGDSTFFHSGTTGLINAVYNDSRFILVILDNHVTAMTGMQPSITQGDRVDGRKGNAISLETIVKGCGINYLKVVDPYDTKTMIQTVKDAADHVNDPDGGIAVIISRHPCVIAFKDQAIPEQIKVRVSDECNDCGFCHTRFECPALIQDKENGKTEINELLCAECGVCIQICPQHAIEKA